LLLIILLVNSCKKELFQGITEPDRIHTSNLFIKSTPDSLRIYVDHKFLGAFSPDTVSWLPSGSHKITLKHELYPDTSFFVELINNETVAKDNTFTNHRIPGAAVNLIFYKKTKVTRRS